MLRVDVKVYNACILYNSGTTPLDFISSMKNKRQNLVLDDTISIYKYKF